MTQTMTGLNSLHNTRSGRVFILGTGPSLLGQLPLLEGLKGEPTFACNSLLKWDALPFTPTYYGITDIYEQKRIDFYAGMLHKETTAFNVQWPGFYNNQRFIPVEKAHDSQQMRNAGFLGLHELELPPLPTGRTTPLTLAQLAAWMGYREFYFLGVEQTRGYCHAPSTVISDDGFSQFPGDKNPKYRIAIKDCAKIMRQAIEDVGGQVFDCSPGGILNVTGKGLHDSVSAADILPYKDLKDVLGE